MGKLTDRPALITPTPADLIHVVDVSDTTDDPAGSSKKVTLGDIASLVATENTYTQAFTGLATVVVTHNLGKYPSPIIIDSAGDEIEGNINHDSLNQLTVSFNGSNTGTVICN